MLMLDVTKKDFAAVFSHLTDEQWQRVDALNAAYVELLSSDSAPSKADVEALADAAIAFYDEIVGEHPALENRA